MVGAIEQAVGEGSYMVEAVETIPEGMRSIVMRGANVPQRLSQQKDIDNLLLSNYLYIHRRRHPPEKHASQYAYPRTMAK